MNEHCPLTFVYWIHKEEHTDKFTEGYIGVTSNPHKRWKQHKADTKRGKHPNNYLSHAIAKYGDTLVYEIVYLGEASKCYDYEKQLRPEPSIGWNLMSGGPVGKITVEGRKRISEFNKLGWTEVRKTDLRYRNYQKKHNCEISKTRFLELEAISKKQVPPNKVYLEIMDLSTGEVYKNIKEASTITEIPMFEIFIETTIKGSFWVFTKDL